MNLTLAIESSCDETSLALLDTSNITVTDEISALNQIRVLDSIVSSQIEIHKAFGGVIPEIGARQHAGQIHLIYQELLDNCKVKYDLDSATIESHITTIKVTTSPGLVSALRVGLEFARSIKYFISQKYNTKIQIKEINHLKGHFSSCFYHPDEDTVLNATDIFPHLHLLVSGGNSQLLFAQSLQQVEIIGQTIDDAAGECMDKIGRMVGLPYPGGLWMSRIIGQQTGNPVGLTVPLKNKKSLEFSFSGLKTAARYYLQAQQYPEWSFERKLSDSEMETLLNYNTNNNHDLQPYLKMLYNLLLSSQTVALQHLVDRLQIAIKEYQPKTLGLSGGVSASPLLREKVAALGLPSLLAPKSLTGDNAVMIGLVN